ncbi:hypothetical protein [Bacillus thuringiensis]|uniref:Uncharacterized protein n=1 Tax=Bacillus thuringiensis Bt18247 TaxID=1423143 RepID=A0A9W3XBV3_BACTU|nr:hypothetical protein [Bacillus thuringiensis]AOM14241.1 hypothetical protein BTI247_59090 [Bacillus thuringiensis Bt18247]MBG9528260.1 hypothetical protein [Bacillus thuringiensis]
MIRKIYVPFLIVGILFTNFLSSVNSIYASEIYTTNSLNKPSHFVHKETRSSEIKINGVTYKWMEKSYSGTNRGMLFNPGRHEYQFKPNPHDDPWYNKNQGKFYSQVAKQVETKGNSDKWTPDKWPSSIRGISVNGISYTLE